MTAEKRESFENLVQGLIIHSGQRIAARHGEFALLLHKLADKILNKEITAGEAHEEIAGFYRAYLKKLYTDDFSLHELKRLLDEE